MFPQLLESNPALQGLNVTIPHKQAVIPFLHHIDDAAKEIGAVNCIRMEQGKCLGFNTDYIGFTQSLKAQVTTPIKALVLGNGGSSKAICYALQHLNIAFLQVARNENADLSYEQITDEIADEYKLWINCTPIGMSPHINQCLPLPYEVLGPSYVLYDLIYNPEETMFLKKGREVGASIINGLEMLHIQAEESWRIWNN